MKKDYLEKFIEKNKKEWDDKVAPKELWSKIEHILDTEDNPPSSPWKTISILLFTILGLLIALHFFNKKATKEESSELRTNIIEYAELQDFKETENFFLSSINVSYEKLNKYDVDATLEEDLGLLDAMNQQLLEEYKLIQGAHKEKVLRAIIQNHKIKLQILENVLYNHEKSDRDINDRIF